MEEICIADIVRSVAGRDKEMLFFVLSVCDGYAYLADGKIRKLRSPKRKKLGHLMFVSQSEAPAAREIKLGGTVSDKEIRKTLAAFRARSGQMTEEGKKLGKR